MNDAALEQANDSPAVVEVPREAVEFPRQDGVCVTALDPANHIIEDLTPWLFRALAFRERFHNGQAMLLCDGVQLGKLGVNRKHLAIFVLGGLAAVKEIFKHGHSIANDIIDCEYKMMQKSKSTMPKEAWKALRGESARERLLHRLHSVALVLNGASASQAARIYGDSLRAVAYWVKRFKQQGMDGLEEGLRPGRPSRLNAAQQKKVQTFLKRSTAKRKSVKAQMLADYILREFGISLTTRQCWRILKQLTT